MILGKEYILGIDFGVNCTITSSSGLTHLESLRYFAHDDNDSYVEEKIKSDYFQSYINDAPSTIKKWIKSEKATVTIFEKQSTGTMNYKIHMDQLKKIPDSLIEENIFYVDSENTSKICARCGEKGYRIYFTNAKTDMKESLFYCNNCFPKGIDADLNAARVIAIKGGIELAKEAKSKKEEWKNRFYILLEDSEYNYERRSYRIECLGSNPKIEDIPWVKKRNRKDIKLT